MTERASQRRRWPRRAVDLDQGVWILLVVGVVVLVAGLVGLFVGLDEGATAVALLAGAGLTGLATVLFSLASPRYLGTASMLGETLFDYTEAKGRLAALDLPDHLREPFLRLARGEAALAYLEVVLREVEAGGDQGPGLTVRVDGERIAENAVERAAASLRGAAGALNRAPVSPSTPPLSSGGGADTLDSPLPPV